MKRQVGAGDTQHRSRVALKPFDAGVREPRHDLADLGFRRVSAHHDEQTSSVLDDLLNDQMPFDPDSRQHILTSEWYAHMLSVDGRRFLSAAEVMACSINLDSHRREARRREERVQVVLPWVVLLQRLLNA